MYRRIDTQVTGRQWTTVWRLVEASNAQIEGTPNVCFYMSGDRLSYELLDTRWSSSVLSQDRDYVRELVKYI